MTDPTKIFPKEDKCLSLDVMMDYIHDRLSNKERNRVERHMLQCEFCNEAMEGLSLSIEDNARNIITSIDEVNHLESQILLSASLQEPEFSLDETSDFSKKELMLEAESSSIEMSMQPAASHMPRNEKSDMRKAKKSVLKEAVPLKNKFNWSRMAAVITGLLLIGGIIFFVIQQRWAKDHPVASVKKSEVNPKDNNIDIVNADSIIAIAPLQKEPLHRDQPYSDGVMNSEGPVNKKALEPRIAGEIQMEEKELMTETRENEMMAMKPNESPAPAKQDTNELYGAVIAMDEDINYKFKKESTVKENSKRQLNSKKKATTPAAPDVSRQDSVFIANNSNTQITSFNKGLNLYNNGEYQQAAIQFLNVKKSDPNYEEARWYLAKSYTATGEKDKAKNVYLELIEMKGKFKKQAEEELRK